MQEVVVVSAKRTAIGSFMGSLKGVKASDLATQVVKAIFDDIGGGGKLSPQIVDELILGQILQSAQGQNPARQVLLNSNINKEKIAFTINDLCGSGLKAVELGYLNIALGEKDFILAGGAENMSASPFLLENIRDGYKMGEQKIYDSMIKDALTDAFENIHMGITAENLAKKYNISRQEQDEFALNSQQKAIKALKSGVFKDEIVPITLKNKKGDTVFEIDEYVKTDISMEALAKLRPAFLKDGTVTAGNSSGINDAAAMLLLTSKKKAKELNLPILATIKAIASVGCEPSIMGIGAAEATKAVLKKAKMTLKNIDIIEANEAFAAQSIACIKELNADASKINVNGGAIALGHPVGASGARIVVTLLHEMKRKNHKLGLATLCIGGGQGIAAIFERS